MKNLIIAFCFYWPLFNSCLQIQNVIAKFISDSMAQIIAYSNLGLILIGIVLLTDNIKMLSKTSRLWFIFYILYYSFGLLASGLSDFQTSIIASIIPVIYFTGFYFLLGDEKQLILFFKVLTISFVLSSFLTIVLFKLNFNFDAAEIYSWDLDRAEGLYGDANNAALTNIIAFILFDKLYNPSKLTLKILKILILLIILYSLVLTFSTTGLFVFTIVFFITNYKFFRGIRIVILAIAITLLYIGIFTIKSHTKELNLSVAQTDKIENIINLLTFNIDKVDNSGRGELFENILYYLYKNPILGNGIEFAENMRAHNTYIGVWVDAGIITFFFFIIMLLYFLFKSLNLGIRLRYFSVSILLTLFIFMISLQSVLNQPYLVVLFVFVGYLIDFSKMDKEKLNFIRN